MADERPVQHTPKHLVDDDVFDRRHPAASSFAPAQPAAGVVADDVEEKGQNLRGGPKASDAQSQYSDQKEVLAEQHEQNLRTAASTAPAPTKVEDGVAKPADSKSTADSKSAKSSDKTK